MNIPGVEIKNGGITPETTKIEAFSALPSPRSFQELGKILGSFTWLSAHIPALQEIASPLHQLLHGEQWFWTDTHENTFQEMKRLVLSRKVRRPIPLLDSGDKVFVFADASLVGCGGMIVAGKSLESAKPVVYHSRVFNPAQSNYPTHEQEFWRSSTFSRLITTCSQVMQVEDTRRVTQAALVIDAAMARGLLCNDGCQPTVVGDNQL